MVGPAREFLRSWRFGENGLVEHATCEAQKLAEGFAAIAMLSPQLSLQVTSLRKRTKATVPLLAKLPLGRVPTLHFSSNLMTDAVLAQLAPAFSGVRSLSLEYNELTADGLLKALPHLKSVKELQIDRPLANDRSVREALLEQLPALELLNQEKVRG
ncbi:MAG: hypothetical protein QM765_48005 [Myxococcales bacterium]